jgi:ribonuclease HI
MYLSSLGWTLSQDKCEFTPSQVIKYLGWIWKFAQRTIEMTADMRKAQLQTVGQWIRKAEGNDYVACRKLGSIIGSLNFLRAQFPRASLYLRSLHTALTRGVRSGGWNGAVSLPQAIISELLWWWRNLFYNTPYDYCARPIQARLTTDASRLGWGAVLEIADQYWLIFDSYEEIMQRETVSSNRRETTAVLRALLGFRQVLRENQIHSLALRTDNMVTVFNMQRIGASESLLHETREIFSLLTQDNIRLTVSHVPGIQNDLTDALSRMDSAGDYELKEEIYRRAMQQLQFSPSIDLFASVNNKKCSRFMALPGPLGRGAQGHDALLYSWEKESPYVFPPIQMMPRVLQKLRQERLTAAVVLPEWYSKAWWNLAQPNIVRYVTLGKAQEVLRAGPAMPEEAKLPPGNLLMAIVSYN